MTNIVQTFIGSGTIPATRAILPAEQRGTEPLGLGVRTGIQTIVANPEDLNSVDAFVASGIFVGSTPVQIWGPGINTLPRQRTLVVSNEGPANSDLFIGHSEEAVIAPSGFRLRFQVGNIHMIELPFLHNVQVWANSPDGCNVSIIAY